MKGRQILIDHLGDRMAAALLVDGQLDDLLIDPPETRARPGAIYRAIVDRPMKGQGGRILRLPEGSTGFLRDTKGLADGDRLLVQVTGYAEPGKAVPVTARILFKSRYCIVTPGALGRNVSRAIRDDEARVRLHDIAHEAELNESFGLILRSVAEHADSDDVADDIAETAALAQAVCADQDSTDAELLLDGPTPDLLAWRDWGDIAAHDVITEAGCFAAHGILETIADLRKIAVPLSGGGSFFVEPTRALVAVDVNTGADTSPAAGLKANIGAAKALPRALRLRGLGGQITIDFAPMPKKDRRQVEQALRAAFRSDPIETALVGWTPLGHFELQRKRERLPLPESL
ncbi:ribonuclease E/G [Pseudoruegeria sp. SK021]|uniref:ribonuclease E/G n=1 Tax=Pseudoruegeria sp. SK021 TaxID=1933035 RepID=UPI000A21541B|nr:ribonuclease E/G [Pseudoruegeria sp. SK021]OSP54062.1 ribonuclease G [Pseudoruegeria sp. SK021]